MQALWCSTMQPLSCSEKSVSFIDLILIGNVINSKGIFIGIIGKKDTCKEINFFSLTH